MSLEYIETCSTFAEFVKAFSQFGNDMVLLAHLSGDRQNVRTCLSTLMTVYTTILHTGGLITKRSYGFCYFLVRLSQVESQVCCKFSTCRCDTV